MAKKEIEGFKEFWITLLFSLAGVAIVVFCSLKGFWFIGVILFVICILSVLLKINNDQHWFDFGVFYLKASAYLCIATLSFGKLILDGNVQTAINESMELFLIAIVSFIECIHNFVEWKRTLDRMGQPVSE